MKKLILLFILINSIILGQIIRPDSTRISEWKNFNNISKGNWKIRWNENTGLPRSIYGSVTKKHKGNPKDVSIAFLKNNRKLFGFKDELSDIKIEQIKSNRDVNHIKFQQYYKNIKVEDAVFKVHVRNNGQIDMINGIYYPNINITSNPSISSSEAIKTVIQDLDIKLNSKLSKRTELVILPYSHDKFILAWKVIVYSSKPMLDWQYYIDANSGKIISKYDRIIEITGAGNVYPQHPYISSVTSKNLYRLSGNGKLQGSYAYILNDQSSEAYSSTHNFYYDETNIHFDEVNLYYHIDNYRYNFIDNLGNIGFNQINAYCNVTSYPGPNNAWFSPSSQQLYFGTGSGSNFESFSREDKIIYHEYTHAAVYDINSGIDPFEDDEEGAICEGLADYFPASYTGRSQIGDYSIPMYSRNLSDPDITSYSGYEANSPVECHTGGEFFSAVLWDLRNNELISSDQCNFIIFDAIHRITNESDFIEFRNALVTADNSAYR